MKEMGRVKRESTLANPLEDEALGALLLCPAEEGRASGILEDLTHTLTGLGGALEIVASTDFLSYGHTFFWGDRSLVGLPELINGLGITSEILLAADENDGQALAEVHHLGYPLFLDVVERVGTVDSEADEDDVGIRVGQGSETVVVFLPCGIPQGKLDMFAVNLDVSDVVLEYCRYVDLGESAFGKDDKETGLSASTVADDY